MQRDGEPLGEEAGDFYMDYELYFPRLPLQPTAATSLRSII
jgi:hypothetical protein